MFSSLPPRGFLSPAELEWSGEAAGAGRADRQLRAHAGQAHDAGDRAAVPARLHLPAAQRGEEEDRPPPLFSTVRRVPQLPRVFPKKERCSVSRQPLVFFFFFSSRQFVLVINDDELQSVS